MFTPEALMFILGKSADLSERERPVSAFPNGNEGMRPARSRSLRFDHIGWCL